MIKCLNNLVDTNYCSANDVEFVSLSFSNGKSEIRTGKLNVNTAAVSDVRVLSNTAIKTSKFDGSKNMKTFGQLMQSTVPLNGAAVPGNYSFVLAIADEAQYYYLDLAKPTLSLKEYSIPDAKISALYCSDSTFACYIGDWAREGLWLLP